MEYTLLHRTFHEIYFIIKLHCIGLKWPTSQITDGLFRLVSDGQWPFGAGLNGQHWSFRPRLISPPWSQMANRS